MRTWLVLLLAACNSGGGDDYAISPGGGVSTTGGIIPLIDASTGDGELGGTTRVCVITDLRTPFFNCSPDKAAGLLVVVGDQMATTNMAGSFDIPPPSGDGNKWRITSPTGSVNPVVTTVMEYRGLPAVIPAITPDAFRDLLQGSGVQQINNLHGSIVLIAIQNLAPLQGVGALVTPLADDTTLYDPLNPNAPTTWDQDPSSTHTRGIILVPNVSITQPVVAVKLTPILPLQPKTFSVGVEDQSITFVTASFP